MNGKKFAATMLNIFLLSLFLSGYAFSAAVQSVEGSEWNFTYTDPVIKTNRNYNVKFAEGGVLVYSNSNDTPNNAFWEQKGDMIYIYLNDKYATYEGRLASKDLIKGKAKNINNITWEFELRRKNKENVPTKTGTSTSSAGKFQSIEGTEWKLTYFEPKIQESRNYDVKFIKGGRYFYSEPADTTPYNDFWEQKGDMVYIYVNDKYATYEGRMVSDDLIKGKARNVQGMSWDFEIKRKN